MPPSNKVYLALEHFAFQGDNLIGIYTTQESAYKALEGKEQNPEVMEIELDTVVNEWMGN